MTLTLENEEIDFIPKSSYVEINETIVNKVDVSFYKFSSQELLDKFVNNLIFFQNFIIQYEENNENYYLICLNNKNVSYYVSVYDLYVEKNVSSKIDEFEPIEYI